MHAAYCTSCCNEGNIFSFNTDKTITYLTYILQLLNCIGAMKGTKETTHTYQDNINPPDEDEEAAREDTSDETDDEDSAFEVCTAVAKVYLLSFL